MDYQRLDVISKVSVMKEYLKDLSGLKDGQAPHSMAEGSLRTRFYKGDSKVRHGGIQIWRVRIIGNVCHASLEIELNWGYG